MISSPSDPFLFIIQGEVPALKNEHTFNPHTGQVGTPPRLRAWYAKQQTMLMPQLKLQAHLDPIITPNRAYVRFELFAEDALGPTDLDNAMTSCLDMLQPKSKSQSNKGFLGVLHNDSHIQALSAIQMPLQPFTGPMAYLWLWQWMDGDDISQLMMFAANRQQELDKRLKKKTIPAQFLD
jgi:hypothetical protein